MKYSAIVMINYVDYNNKDNGLAKILLDSDNIEECISQIKDYRNTNKNIFKTNGFNEIYGINVDDESYDDIHVSYELLVFDGTKYNKKNLYIDKYENSDLVDYFGVCRYKLTTLVKTTNDEMIKLIELSK
jgi:hypothetical protein